MNNTEWRRLYQKVVDITQVLAKEKGILWEEEQAEIALAMLEQYNIEGSNLLQKESTEDV